MWLKCSRTGFFKNLTLFLKKLDLVLLNCHRNKKKTSVAALSLANTTPESHDGILMVCKTAEAAKEEKHSFSLS